MFASKRAKPTVACQYGVNCYRKNPHHFIEYAHEHLEKIMEQNTFSDELISHKDLILEQIKVIKELFPEKKSKDGEPTKTCEMIASSSKHQNIEQKQDMDKTLPVSVSTSQQHYSAKYDIHKYIKVVAPKGKMQAKLEAARPYNFFLTSITSSEPTHTEPLSITFQEILDPSLGELESSVQINFMVEIGWLLGQYYFAGLFI